MLNISNQQIFKWTILGYVLIKLAMISIFSIYEHKAPFYPKPFQKGVPADDHAFYVAHLDTFRNFANFSEIYTLILNHDHPNKFLDPIPGPILPWILILTGYEKSGFFTYLFYNLLSVGTVLLMLKYLALRGGLNVWSCSLILINPYFNYYPHVFGTTLISIFCWTAFLYQLQILFLEEEKTHWRSLSMLYFIVLTNILLRPNFIILVPIALILTVKFLPKRVYPIIIVYFLIYGSLGVLSTLYYIPYYKYEIFGNWIYEKSHDFTYFHYTIADLKNNFWWSQLIFGGNLIATFFIAIIKVLYLFGIRISYNITGFQEYQNYITIIRITNGLPFLIGAIYLFYKRNFQDCVIVTFFLLPLVLANPQERYILPIAILFIYYFGIFAPKFLVYCNTKMSLLR